MINFKSHIIARTLDDQSSDFNINKNSNPGRLSQLANTNEEISNNSANGAKRKQKA
jgi:hypothetical protein